MLARREFIRFVQYVTPGYVVEPVHLYVAQRLQAFVEACERGESPRLILKMPPQHGKSTLSSRCLPAWILGRNPTWKVALMAYSFDWASDLSGDARDIARSEEYARLWPRLELDQSSSAKDEWGFTRKAGAGRMKGVGRDGGITGRPAHVLILDDPIKNRKEADSEAIREDTFKGYGPNFRTRVQKGGGILVVYTPWHHDDLPARLEKLAKDDPTADQWEVINLPALAEEGDPLGRPVGAALAPNRYDVPDLLAIKASIPPRDWQALYCGKPSADEGAVFKAPWFRYEDDPGAPGRVWQFADTAYSTRTGADYTVVQTWRFEQAACRLLDVYRARLDFPSLKQTIQALFTRHRAEALVVEDVGSGKSLIQELRAGDFPVIAWKPDRDKVARAHAITPLFQAGRVIFPVQAPWLAAFVEELERFPVGEHDDQVDAMTMGLTFFRPAQPVEETVLTLPSLELDPDQEVPPMTRANPWLTSVNPWPERVARA